MPNLTMEQLKAKLDKWIKKYPALVVKGFEKVGPVLVDDVRRNRLSGQVLNARTGKLRSSIKFMASGNPKPILRLGTDVNYGAIWMKRGRDFLRPSVKAKAAAIEQAVLSAIMKGYEAAK